MLELPSTQHRTLGRHSLEHALCEEHCLVCYQKRFVGDTLC